MRPYLILFKVFPDTTKETDHVHYSNNNNRCLENEV